MTTVNNIVNNNYIPEITSDTINCDTINANHINGTIVVGGLTPSQTVVSDSSGNLATVPYSNTPSNDAFVRYDSSGNINVSTIKSSPTITADCTEFGTKNIRVYDDDADPATYNITMGYSNPLILRTGMSNPPISTILSIPRINNVFDIMLTGGSDQNITGDKIFTTVCPSSTVAPTVGDHLCNKTYVDSVAGGGGGSAKIMLARKTDEASTNNTTLTSSATYYAVTIANVAEVYNSTTDVSIDSAGIITLNNTSGSTKYYKISWKLQWSISTTATSNMYAYWNIDSGVIFRFRQLTQGANPQSLSWDSDYVYSVPASTSNTAQLYVRNSSSAGTQFGIYAIVITVTELN